MCLAQGDAFGTVIIDHHARKWEAAAAAARCGDDGTAGDGDGAGAGPDGNGTEKALPGEGSHCEQLIMMSSRGFGGGVAEGVLERGATAGGEAAGPHPPAEHHPYPHPHLHQRGGSGGGGGGWAGGQPSPAGGGDGGDDTAHAGVVRHRGGTGGPLGHDGGEPAKAQQQHG